MMERLTIKGNFCDIARCQETHCQNGICDAKLVYERLREYEATGLTPEQVKAQKWISVKDGLPGNEEDDVLIYCREIEHYGKHKEKCHAYHAIYKGAYDGDRWYTNWCYGCKYIEDANAEYPDEEITVTHWMPLPEPPKGAHDE